MDDLAAVKKKLKKWEAGFISNHKRRPDKDDIAANLEIQEAYKNYSKLKKEQELKKPQVEVWGKELNKAYQAKEDANGPKTTATKPKPQSLMKGLGSKLLAKASLQPLKSYNKPSLTPRDSESEDSIPCSQMSSKFRLPKENINNTNHKTSEANSRETAQDKCNENSTVTSFSNALKLANIKTTSFKDKKFEDTGPKDIVISSTLLKKQTKVKLNTRVLEKYLPEEQKAENQANSSKINASVCRPFEMFSGTNTPIRSGTPKSCVPSTLQESADNVKPPGIDFDNNACDMFSDTSRNIKPTRIKSAKTIPTRDSNRDSNSILKDSASADSEIESILSRKPKRKAYDDVGDIEKKVIKRRKSMIRESDSEDDNSTFINVSWRPDSRAEPLMIDLDLSRLNGASPEGSSQQRTDSPSPQSNSPEKQEKLSQRSSQISSKPQASSKPLNNDNFVRLNFKTKSYRRKGKGMTGGQHKRMLWKQKMKSRSESYGSQKCFKCGQEGHWAKQCKGAKNSRTLTSIAPEDNTVNEEDFPSLKEAAAMAKGVKLNKGAARENSNSNKSDIPENANAEVEEEEEDFLDVVRTKYEPPPTPKAMEPLYKINEDGSIPGTPKEVLAALSKFGFDSFRPGQEKAVMRILCGQSTLVVLSTGAGKSLCYQLPAYMYATKKKCISLVISPLVSLMEDQITGLPPGVIGACLHTNMTKAQREHVVSQVMEGSVHFLLVSPEALVGGGGGVFISDLSKFPKVAFACIDEAHCVSEWSHHFRPSYLRLCKVLKERFGVTCILGLTATATMVTAASVSKHLGITDYHAATIRGSPVPDNLCLSVSRDEDKDDALIGLLKGDRFSKCRSIIVYCTRRQQTERVATLIRTCMANEPDRAEPEPESSKKKPKVKSRVKNKGPWHAESYHAGLSAAIRKRIQNAFMAGRLRVIVATVAFGMGLDKSDVQGIVHYNLPKSFESYVQEIGRAGRDGNTAHCHLFLDPNGQDMNELKRHAYSNTVDRYIIKRFVQQVFTPCRCRETNDRATSANMEFDDDGIDYSQIDTEEDESRNNEGALNCDNIEDESESDKTEPQLEKQTKDNEKHQSSQNSSNEDEQNCTESDIGSTKTTNIGPDWAIQDGTSKSKGSTLRSANNSTSSLSKYRERVCPGHERAIPIENTVQNLDMKEEGIATLLCYLELHKQRWVENLQSVYATCTVQCYGGPQQLQMVSRKCPPIAVAIARDRKRGISHTRDSKLEFPVVDISDLMGWDSGPVKRELKLLMWDVDPLGTYGPRKTGVMVEFSDLAFHLRSPGDLTDDEVDCVVDFLHERMTTQETTEIYQLAHLYDTVFRVSHKNVWICSEQVDMNRSNKLKKEILTYFDQQPRLDDGEITALSFSREVSAKQLSQESSKDERASVDHTLGDIRSFIQLYGSEHQLTGRAIARVFHGIPSPCFPAEIWGRVRRFWRCHLDVDFNDLRNLATRELIRIK